MCSSDLWAQHARVLPFHHAVRRRWLNQILRCRGLLKSSLGRFGLGPRKPKVQLEAYDSVWVYVVGGISLADMRAVAAQVQEASAQGRPVPDIALGGTALLSPDDVCLHLLRA